jgi:two-component system, sensor histidine kinase and response regulator
MTEAPIRILHVEDEAESREIADDLLASFGYTVVTVANGAEALAALEAAVPDLILSDVCMPVVDGFQLLRRVRSDQRWFNIPFIILSAKAERSDLRTGMSLGADDFLAKPCDPAEMQKAIEVRVLRARQFSKIMAGNRMLLTQILPHELRNSLMNVIGHADLMMDTAGEGKTLTVPELSEYGRVLHKSGNRILGVAENLIFWATLSMSNPDVSRHSGKAVPVQEEVNALSLAQLAEAPAKRLGRQNDLQIDVPFEARVEVVTTGFYFVARHLIENALRYSPRGTRLTIRALKDGGMLRLVVSDLGPGMSKEQLARVAGYRHLERGATGARGPGMGLLIATTFARLSGGNLELSPGASGTGLVAVLCLPMAPDPEGS